MRKLLPVYILLLPTLSAELSISQNLVSNPSFEFYTSCPVATSELGVATPWTQPSGGTPDYFNVCNTSPFPFPVPVPNLAPVGVPINSLGIQHARTDSAYAGFFSVESNPDDGYREYAQVPLDSALTVGENYCVQFYVSLSDNSVNATDAIGGLFSINPTFVSGSGIIAGSPHVVSSGVIDEKQEWVEVSGNFIASQAYTHLTIGNFNDIGTTTIITSTAQADTVAGGFPALPLPGAYYYLDDVYVGEGTCPNFCNISAEVAVIEATCGQADGGANVIVSGGSGNFTYIWNTGATSANLANVAADIYSVTISDTTGGCDVTQFVMVTEDTDLEIALTGEDVTCSGNGSAEVTISGGVSPYQIMWENSATTDSIGNLPVGIYSVSVMDSAGCSLSDSVEIGSAATFDITPTITHASCDGTTPGSIGVAPSGGSPPYTYSWSTGSSNAIQYNLSGGTYTVTVTDGGGCSIIESYTVNSGNSLSVSITNNGNTLEADAPNAVSYQWYYGGNPIQGATQSTYTITQSGVYWVVVTDANGCELESEPIETSFIDGVEELEGVNEISIYPNPSSGIIYAALDVTHHQKLTISLINAVGQEVISETFNTTTGKKQIELNVEGYADGAYILKVSNAKSSVYRKVIVNK